MTLALFSVTALVIVVAGVRLARYGDVIGEKSGLGGSWVGVVLLAATTSLPELFTGFGATAVTPAPDLAVGDVLGSCMFNLLILSLMDALQPERISARAHQGHVMTLGLGLALISLAGLGLAGRTAWPRIGWMGLYSPLLVAGYLAAARATFIYEQQRLARERQEVAETLRYERLSMRAAVARYSVAALFVVGAALALPTLGVRLATETGLGEAFVGSLFIALTTSLPEVVVSVTAVRMGALDLGIGNILGSNLFNVLILGLDDAFYAPGPLLLAVGDGHLIAVLAVVAMNALFLVGLTQHVAAKRFRVAWDTGAIAVVYACAMWLMYTVRA